MYSAVSRTPQAVKYIREENSNIQIVIIINLLEWLIPPCHKNQLLLIGFKRVPNADFSLIESFFKQMHWEAGCSDANGNVSIFNNLDAKMNFVCKNILISLMHNTADVSHQVYFVQEFVCGRKLFRFSLMHCTDALMYWCIAQFHWWFSPIILFPRIWLW